MKNNLLFPTCQTNRKQVYKKTQDSTVLFSKSSFDIAQSLKTYRKQKLRRLSFIISHAYRFSRCNPGQRMLANIFDIDQSNISRDLAQLERDGLIISRYNGYLKTNDYFLNPELFNPTWRSYFTRFLPSLKYVTSAIYVAYALSVPHLMDDLPKRILLKNISCGLFINKVGVDSHTDSKCALSGRARQKDQFMFNNQEAAKNIRSTVFDPGNLLKLSAFPVTVLETIDRELLKLKKRITPKEFVNACDIFCKSQGIKPDWSFYYAQKDLTGNQQKITESNFSSPEPSAEESISEAIAHLKTPKTNRYSKSPYEPFGGQETFNLDGPRGKFKACPKPDEHGNYPRRERPNYLEGLSWNKERQRMVADPEYVQPESVASEDFSAMVKKERLSPDHIQSLMKSGKLNEFLEYLNSDHNYGK